MLAHLNTSAVPAYNRRTLPIQSRQWHILDSAHTSYLSRTESKTQTLIDVHSRVMVVSSYAVVITSDPVAVLDLAGGCCRPEAAFSFMQLASIDAFLRNGRGYTSPEHAWLFLASHFHSSTYFHALGEAAPKLIWGLRLLRENPTLKVLHSSRFIDEVLHALHLPGRAVAYDSSKRHFARRVTVPPPAYQLDLGPLQALRRELMGSVEARLPLANRARSVLVVRRSAMIHGGGRALLNHDELMFTLRNVLLDRSVALAEWPPTGTTLKQAVKVWSEIDTVIAPHGAGLTNVLFLPPGSTVIEIVAKGQKGRVYGTMARLFGHKFTTCEYVRDGPGSTPLSLPAHAQAAGAFSLNMSYFMCSCIQNVKSWFQSAGSSSGSPLRKFSFCSWKTTPGSDVSMYTTSGHSQHDVTVSSPTAEPPGSVTTPGSERDPRVAPVRIHGPDAMALRT